MILRVSTRLKWTLRLAVSKCAARLAMSDGRPTDFAGFSESDAEAVAQTPEG